MRLVIQRSAAASVTVDGTVVGSIDRGAVILLAAVRTELPRHQIE